VLYLTFDDGPHPTITPFVLDTLRQYQAKATFFCIGKNVEAYPGIYAQIMFEGHAVGNHTQHHVNGWEVSDEAYLDDITTASKHIKSNLFRPPYGRIKKSQMKKIKQQFPDMRIVMWDVLSADFDTRLNADACLGYTVYHSKSGSIVLFHDSEKAFPRMQTALPKMLAHFANEGYTFEAIKFNA
jgi:peptidoglycan/xylan/chitin deacetylase (PgdA/CDA1 family)